MLPSRQQRAIVAIPESSMAASSLLHQHQRIPESTSTVDDTPSKDLFTSLLHLSSSPGFMTLSRLYWYQGTLYAVVKDEESKAAYPHRKFILSQPVKSEPLPSEPTDRVGLCLLSDC